MTESAIPPPAPRRPRRRPRWLGWAFGPALALAAAAHLLFWYAPRQHAVRPDPEDLPAAVLLAAGPAPLRLWLAFPHQNLAASRATMLAEVARVFGPALPAFGPFRLPPSRELAVAAGSQGGVAAARVYPILSWVARAAGALADNPWLGGGAVWVDGREGEVEWRGTLWTVRWGDAVLPVPAGTTAALPGIADLPRTALAWLDPPALGLDLPALPGVWALAASDAGLRLERLATEGVAPSLDDRPLLAPDSGQRSPELALLASRRRGSGWEALILIDQAQDPGILRLPSAAVAESAEGGARRFSLPAEELQRALGARLRQARHGGWSIVGSDQRSVELARRLLPFAPDDAGDPGVERWEIGLRPAAVHRLARAVDEALEVLPVGSRRTRARWRRYRDWSDALRGYAWVALSLEPDRIQVIFEPAPRGAASD
ncbi:MAG TPA: hypothetical protein VMV46_20000 [Thermoanaerobaculia bacterium]|nr:hypothetical protein [Thermoanaerobaculia bacterium]